MCTRERERKREKVRAIRLVVKKILLESDMPLDSQYSVLKLLFPHLLNSQ